MEKVIPGLLESRQSNQRRIMAKYSDEAMLALTAYLQASEACAQEPDETYGAAFIAMQPKLDRLRQFFSQPEVDVIICRRNELMAILRASVDKFKRDTTKDLFLAVLALVKENGHYDKAAAIMDYVLPNSAEDNIREDIELSDYRFDFEATAQFGGSEGIYIDCYLSGKYTEDERKRYNHSTGQVEPERRRHIGTFKTLKEDVESFKIMGELCGVLVFYARQYVNLNIDRYTPAPEAERERQHALRREAAKWQAIEEAVRNAPPGTFKYGGYHFTPYRAFYKGEIVKRLEGDSRPWKTDMQYAMHNMKSDPDMGLTKAQGRYTYEAFYAAADSNSDIFRCIENGRLYVPHENELFQYTEPPCEKRC